MAKSAPFFPFYTRDWLEDEKIFDMGLECEGAYIRLLAAMWERGGSIRDDTRFVCNVLRCKPAKWKKIRLVLIDEFSVFYVENERIFNQRLTEELRVFNEKSAKNSQNASKKWQKCDKVETSLDVKITKKSNKNSNHTNANAERSQCYTDTDTDTDTEENKKICTNSSGIGTASSGRPKQTDLTQTKITPSRFDEFWVQWPVKAKKKPAFEIWKRKRLDENADLIIADVCWRKSNCYKWTRGFIHNVTTYLNQELWEDERITADQATDRGIVPNGREVPDGDFGRF